MIDLYQNVHCHHHQARRYCCRHTQDSNFTQHTGIPIVTLCAEGFGYTSFGLEVLEVSVPLSITQYCKEQRQMVRLTHTLSLCLSVHPSQSHHQHYHWKAGKATGFFFTAFKKTWETDSSKCDTLTLGFLLYEKPKPCFLIWYIALHVPSVFMPT